MEIYSQRGYYRRVCRRVFDIIGDNYRHRGRGESTFGSLTNQYGDRLKTRRLDTTATRILARPIAHTTKIPIRTKEAIIIVIIRHARLAMKLWGYFNS
jgi:hypothetical protein